MLTARQGTRVEEDPPGEAPAASAAQATQGRAGPGRAAKREASWAGWAGWQGNLCGVCRCGAAPGWKQNGSNGSCGTRRRILWGLVPARSHMARAEMRIRVSIFFDPPELDFRVAPRACRPNVSMTATALRTTSRPRRGLLLARWLRVPSQASIPWTLGNAAFSACDRRRPTAPRRWD